MSDTHARTVHASSVFERLFERGGGEGGSRGVGEIDPADPMLFARIGLFIDPAGAFLGAKPREGDRVFPLSSIRRQVDVHSKTIEAIIGSIIDDPIIVELLIAIIESGQ